MKRLQLISISTGSEIQTHVYIWWKIPCSSPQIQRASSTSGHVLETLQNACIPRHCHRGQKISVLWSGVTMVIIPNTYSSQHTPMVWMNNKNAWVLLFSQLLKFCSQNENGFSSHPWIFLVQVVPNSEVMTTRFVTLRTGVSMLNEWSPIQTNLCYFLPTELNSIPFSEYILSNNCVPCAVGDNSGGTRWPPSRSSLYCEGDKS